VFLDATSPTQLDDYIALGILGLYLERGCRVEVIRLAGGLSSSSSILPLRPSSHPRKALPRKRLSSIITSVSRLPMQF
jgi:hypothetical protein